MRTPERRGPNGNTVPIQIAADGTAAILIVAAGNPRPEPSQFAFGPLAGSRSASTRIRLAKTQDVIAIAKMEDRTFLRVSRAVKVTIGGYPGQS